MLKEAFSYLVGLGKTVPATETIDGEIYLLSDSGRVRVSLAEAITRDKWSREDDARQREIELLHRKMPTIKTNTLTSISEYCKGNPEGCFDAYNEPFIHIESADCVTLNTMLDPLGRRECAISAAAIVPKLRLGQKMPLDEFIVMLQSQFADTPDKQKILNLVSNMEDQESLHIKDNGMRQTVTVKSGVADVERETIPNPVLLAPFRTFTEVEQPRSHYSIRIYGANELALYEVGGNEWQIIAMQNIKAWLDEQFKDTGVVIIV